VATGTSFEDYEKIVIRNDAKSGLRAVIAVHSTALGPALGGTRFRTYPSVAHGLEEALMLSRAMTFKHAVAGTRCGGGKAVIIAGKEGKSPQVLAEYADLVESLSGQYVTACDVGTDTRDLAQIASRTRYVTGRSRDEGGLGETAELTALGVLYAMEAAAGVVWGSRDLEGKTVSVLGVGKVGAGLVEHLMARNARVRVADISAVAVEDLASRHPRVEVVDVDSILSESADVFSPCALGGVLTPEVVAGLRAEIVCGAANNQLASAEVAEQLRDGGICYVPDYLANCGGVIQGAAEYFGEGMEAALGTLAQVRATTERVLLDAMASGTTTLAATDALARDRISQESAKKSVDGQEAPQ